MIQIPKISVILPFWNAEKTLGRAISSIINQDYLDFELILIDNNSTDGSREIAEQWSLKEKRVILCNEQNQGVVHASNRGAGLARGQYIARMDADDEALPNRLTIQSKYLDKYSDCDAVAGLVEHVPHSDNARGFSRFVDWSNSIQTYKQIYNNRFIELPVVNPTLMWRSELAESRGLYRSGNFPEDYEMILRWLDTGVKIVKIPEKVLKWYDSETRLTRTDEKYSDQSFYNIKSRYLADWLQLNNPFHPYISIWGASRISRRRARLLEQYGIIFQNYIDTKKGRQLEKSVIYHEELPEAGELFILTYIRQMDNRDRIRTFLNARGYEEGKDYLVVS
ncbi:MAG: glycosyltransferase family 2 protein [Bacteroidales bacterium]